MMMVTIYSLCPKDWCNRRWVYGKESWAAVAALAPVVIACAANGDAAALDILKGAADDIASAVSAVLNQLPDLMSQLIAESLPQNTERCKPWHLVFSGGLLLDSKNSAYIEAVSASLRRCCPGAIFVHSSESAEIGAAHLAWTQFHNK